MDDFFIERTFSFWHFFIWFLMLRAYHILVSFHCPILELSDQLYDLKTLIKELFLINNLVWSFCVQGWLAAADEAVIGCMPSPCVGELGAGMKKKSSAQPTILDTLDKVHVLRCLHTLINLKWPSDSQRYPLNLCLIEDNAPNFSRMFITFSSSWIML